MIKFYLWVLSSLYYFASSSHIYYLVPYPVSDGNCSVNSTTLSPCCTIEQFIKDASSFTSNINSLVLYVLSGTHLMPENLTLEIRDMSDLVILP